MDQDTGLAPVRRVNAPPLESLADRTAAARAQLAQTTSTLRHASLQAKYLPLASAALQSPLGKTAEVPASPPGFTDEATAHFHFDIARPESKFERNASGVPMLALANGHNISLSFDDAAVAEGIKNGKLKAIVTGVNLSVISPNVRALEISTPGLKARAGEKGYGIGDGTPLAHIKASDIALGRGCAQATVFQREFSDTDRGAMKAHSATIASGLDKTFVKTPMGTHIVGANTPLALMGAGREGVTAYEDHTVFKDDAVFKAVFAETDKHIKENFSLMDLADFRVHISPLGARSFLGYNSTDTNVHLAGDGEVSLRLFETADAPL